MCADRRSPGNAVNVATHVLFQSRLLCTWPQTHQTHHYRSTNDSLLEFFRPFLCRVRLIRQDWSNWIKFYTFHPSNDHFSVERWWKKVCEPLLRFPQGWRIGGCTCALVDVASSSQGCRGGSRPRETGTTPGATWNRGWISKPSALWSKNAVVSCTGFSAFGSWRKSLRGTKVQRRTEREGNSLCK